MVDPIEVPDYASKPPTPDKLIPVVRSDPEKDRNGFSRALRDKMKEELEAARKNQKDRLEIGHDSTDEDQAKDKQKEPSDDPARRDSDEPAAPADHVDVKA
jgi:hypothetical protein